LPGRGKRIVGVLALLAIFLAAPDSRSTAAERAALVWPKKLEIAQGELNEVSVAGPSLEAVEGAIGQEQVFFFPSGANRFTALVGIDVDAKPVLSKLSITARAAGLDQRRNIPLKVRAKNFHQEAFTVAPGFDQPTPENLEEIRREQAAFARAFATPSTARLWDAPFVRPVPHQESASSFGRRRIINGKPRAPHSGLDLSAPAGTEVRASNNAKVILAGDFFFAGGSVVLDHGGGLFTMYFHLSEIRVGEGALVRKGDIVALSGATGRVTGAHLHWGARLANARIDPLELLTKVSPHWQPADFRAEAIEVGRP
jgi:murein DD-endopeptidase MepM/ murein hydrolase activator NlpD